MSLHSKYAEVGSHMRSERVKRIMKNLVRNQEMQVANTVLRGDIRGNDIQSLHEDTISAYINALKR